MRITGIAVNLAHWRVRWTKGYTAWERILWIGPVGLLVRDAG